MIALIRGNDVTWKVQLELEEYKLKVLFSKF
jgi:hypothetical protein